MVDIVVYGMPYHGTIPYHTIPYIPPPYQRTIDQLKKCILCNMFYISNPKCDSGLFTVRRHQMSPHTVLSAKRNQDGRQQVSLSHRSDAD
jgi:hypothetical protein